MPLLSTPLIWYFLVVTIYSRFFHVFNDCASRSHKISHSYLPYTNISRGDIEHDAGRFSRAHACGGSHGAVFPAPHAAPRPSPRSAPGRRSGGVSGRELPARAIRSRVCELQALHGLGGQRLIGQAAGGRPDSHPHSSPAECWSVRKYRKCDSPSSSTRQQQTYVIVFYWHAQRAASWRLAIVLFVDPPYRYVAGATALSRCLGGRNRKKNSRGGGRSGGLLFGASGRTDAVCDFCFGQSRNEKYND